MASGTGTGKRAFGRAARAPANGSRARGAERRSDLCGRRGPRRHARMRASLEEQEGAAEVLDSAELEKREIQDLLAKPYKFGFVSDIESEQIPKGLSEETVRRISAKKKVSRRDAPSRRGARDTGGRARET